MKLGMVSWIKTMKLLSRHDQIDIRLKNGRKMKLAQKQIENIIGKYLPNNVVFQAVLLFFDLTNQSRF